ncbi:MAG TPA: ATP-binding protein [Actinophytocola sp.]|uniref:AAA family ATPase n=1 Tax=Actinophytocola sp. TaxID=1872138 RepID=UPI002DDD554C|nr:ATP-binding protein [Actinophytocola sp.]HEV2781347.1 ATP-binding protein [Actinophytocola sp.]
MTSDRYFVLVMGVPGSGKTTLARRIIRRVHWVYLDNNFIMDPFYAETRDSPEFVGLRPRFYEALYNVAAHNLALGNTVLLDAPHVRPMKDPRWWGQMQYLADDACAALKVVRCYCSEATLRRRIEDRAEKRDVAKLQDWEGFLREEPIRSPIPVDHVEINTEIETATDDKVLRYVMGGDLSNMPIKRGCGGSVGGIGNAHS